MLVHAHEITATQLRFAERMKTEKLSEEEVQREQPALENVAVVGLLLGKYIADKDASDWEDVLMHEDQVGAEGQVLDILGLGIDR